jgi:hypothetical protein
MTTIHILRGSMKGAHVTQIIARVISRERGTCADGPPICLAWKNAGKFCHNKAEASVYPRAIPPPLPHCGNLGLSNGSSIFSRAGCNVLIHYFFVANDIKKTYFFSGVQLEIFIFLFPLNYKQFCKYPGGA